MSSAALHSPSKSAQRPETASPSDATGPRGTSVAHWWALLVPWRQLGESADDGLVPQEGLTIDASGGLTPLAVPRCPLSFTAEERLLLMGFDGFIAFLHPPGWGLFLVAWCVPYRLWKFGLPGEPGPLTDNAHRHVHDDGITHSHPLLHWPDDGTVER